MLEFMCSLFWVILLFGVVNCLSYTKYLSDEANCVFSLCIKLWFPLSLLYILYIHAFCCSEDEDDERHSTDPDSRDPKNPKKTLGKIKWSRDEVPYHFSLVFFICLCCVRFQSNTVISHWVSRWNWNGWDFLDLSSVKIKLMTSGFYTGWKAQETCWATRNWCLEINR